MLYHAFIHGVVLNGSLLRLDGPLYSGIVFKGF